MRYFVFLRILEEDISDLLDIAIYALNPFDKWGAHVTLAGPYHSRKNLPRDREFLQKISIIGATQFRSEIQNTVVLRVGSKDLKSVWDKPDYPFNPHLTIYDGRDNKLGDALFRKLTDLRPFLIFHTSRLEVVKAPKDEPKLPLMRKIEFRKEYHLPISSLEEVWEMSTVEQVDLAVLAIKRAKDLNLHGGI